MRVAVKLALVSGILGVGGALAAQGSALAMLAKLQRGQWTVTSNDGAPARSICLGDPLQLVKLRHAGIAGCSRFVVEDEPGKVTVQYTCRGNGYGRTSIRRETDSLVQIESQGIADGRPFQFRAEARRTGSCR
jgi:hypothetical protein